MKLNNNFWKENSFVIGLITIITLLNIYVFMIEGTSDIIGIIASITGVFCVVLTAKGNIWCYAFGLINIIAYIIIAVQANYQGEVILNGFYYLPMQFYGIAVWKKHLNEDSNIVKSKIMNIKQLFLLIIISIIGVLCFMVFLKSRGSNLPLLDATSTVLSVVAMYISVKMFAEQWILWIVIDMVTIVMWVIPAIKGETNSIPMVIMWTAYLVNAIYGYITWRKNAVNKGGLLNE